MGKLSRGLEIVKCSEHLKRRRRPLGLDCSGPWESWQEEYAGYLGPDLGELVFNLIIERLFELSDSHTQNHLGSF